MNVPAVLAQMRGDSVGAGFDRQQRRADRIGTGTAARIAHGRDMIDIDAEPQRCHRVPFLREFEADQAAPASARLPGLTAGTAASSGGRASGG